MGSGRGLVCAQRNTAHRVPRRQSAGRVPILRNFRPVVDGLRLRRDSQGPLRDLYSKIPIDALRIGHSQRIAPGIDGLIRQQRSVLIPRKGHLIIGGAAAHLGCCRILHRIPIIRFWLRVVLQRDRKGRDIICASGAIWDIVHIANLDSGTFVLRQVEIKLVAVKGIYVLHAIIFRRCDGGVRRDRALRQGDLHQRDVHAAVCGGKDLFLFCFNAAAGDGYAAVAAGSSVADGGSRLSGYLHPTARDFHSPGTPGPAADGGSVSVGGRLHDAARNFHRSVAIGSAANGRCVSRNGCIYLTTGDFYSPGTLVSAADGGSVFVGGRLHGAATDLHRPFFSVSAANCGSTSTGSCHHRAGLNDDFAAILLAFSTNRCTRHSKTL